MLTIFCGCSESKKLTVDLATEPVADNKSFDMTSKDTLQIKFTLPQAGYLKLLAYDNTEYDEMPDGFNKVKLELTDEKGKTLKFDDISGGYSDKTLFEKGTVIAKITFAKRFKGMNKASVSWGFAPDTNVAQKVTVNGGIAAAKVNGDSAKFTFNIVEAGIYKINCGELCTFESNCKFTLESRNDTIAKDVFIHETEWYYRRFFLDIGAYTITTKDIDGVARCSVVKAEDQPENMRSKIPEQIVATPMPLAIGVVSGEQVINGRFTADGSAKSFCINADGPDAFYDSLQTYDLVIKDSSGQVVIDEKECETNAWDISKYKGEYSFALTSHGNGIYEFKLSN